MSGDGRLVRALVACYPSGWRRRYGDEYAALLGDLRIHRRPGLLLDSLRGAVRAHAGALLAGRSPLTAVVWAAALFTVAGGGFAKLAEDSTRRAAGPYAVLVAAAAVTFVALAFLAAPTVLAVVRGRDRGARKYLAVPVVGGAAWYGVLRLGQALVGRLTPRSAPPELPAGPVGANVAGFAVVAAAGLAVVAATAWAADTVLRRVPAGQPAWLHPAAMTTVTGGMAAAAVAAVLWGLRVRSADPAGFHGHQGILATPFIPSWLAVVAALAAATGLAALGSRRPAAA